MDSVGALFEIEIMIGKLSSVRAWLMAQQLKLPELSGPDAYLLSAAQWNGRAAGDALASLHNEIGNMRLAIVDEPKQD